MGRQRGHFDMSTTAMYVVMLYLCVGSTASSLDILLFVLNLVYEKSNDYFIIIKDGLNKLYIHSLFFSSRELLDRLELEAKREPPESR